MSQNAAAALQPLPIQSNHRQTQNLEAGSDQVHQSLRLTPAAEAKPRWIWRVVQWKYTVDATSKWLKRVYFYYVFLPFNEFSYRHFDLLPPNGRDDTGRLCWTEDQGCVETEWEAEAEAMKYPYGHAVRVPLRARLPAETVHTAQYHPNSTREVRQMYEKKTIDTTIPLPRIDVMRVVAKLAESDLIFPSKAV